MVKAILEHMISANCHARHGTDTEGVDIVPLAVIVNETAKDPDPLFEGYHKRNIVEQAEAWADEGKTGLGDTLDLIGFLERVFLCHDIA